MQLKGQRAVVCGTGDLIGGHLVRSLLASGVNVVRAVDIKPPDEWPKYAIGFFNLVGAKWRFDLVPAA